jgi:hypothetical protein
MSTTDWFVTHFNIVFLLSCKDRGQTCVEMTEKNTASRTKKHDVLITTFEESNENDSNDDAKLRRSSRIHMKNRILLFQAFKIKSISRNGKLVNAAVNDHSNK